MEESSSAILCQISSFKDMLDQVNEEIEQNIQRTREIESEIVKCSEVEKSYLIRESELTKMVAVADFEMNCLKQVVAIRRNSLDTMKRELKSLKINLDETIKRICEKREIFVAVCSNFQHDISSGDEEELRIYLGEKEALENEKHNLNMKINMLENSTRELIAEILEEIESSNAVLEVEVLRGGLENKELLKDINELKILMSSMVPFESA